MTARLKHAMATVLALPRSATIPVALFVLVGVLAPVLAPYDPAAQDLDNTFAGPSWSHPFGTDNLGRDEFSRIVFGAQTSLVAITAIISGAFLIGLIVGAVSGAIGRTFDEVLMRGVDVWMSIPSLVIALVLIGIWGPSFRNMVIALCIAWSSSMVRLARAIVISTKHQPYVESVRLLGASPIHVFRRHLVPPAVGPLLVFATAEAGAIAISVATLSFLGLGVQPPTAEWGQMLVQGLPFLERHPSLVIIPGVALTMVVFGLSSLGETLASRGLARPLSRRAMVRRRSAADAELDLVTATIPRGTRITDSEAPVRS